MKLRGLIVVAVGVVLLSGCSKSPESTVESFYRALGKGEVTEAKGYLSSQLAAKVGDAKVNSALTVEAQRITKCGGVKDVAVALQGEGEIRTGTAVVTYADDAACKQKTEKTSLVKEDGRWKITVAK